MHFNRYPAGAIKSQCAQCNSTVLPSRSRFLATVCFCA